MDAAPKTDPTSPGPSPACTALDALRWAIEHAAAAYWLRDDERARQFHEKLVLQYTGKAADALGYDLVKRLPADAEHAADYRAAVI